MSIAGVAHGAGVTNFTDASPTDSNWSNAGNWDNGVPGSSGTTDDQAYINNHTVQVVNSKVNVFRVRMGTVANVSGSNLVINKGAKLNVSNYFLLGADNDAISTLTNEGTLEGANLRMFRGESTLTNSGTINLTSYLLLSEKGQQTTINNTGTITLTGGTDDMSFGDVNTTTTEAVFNMQGGTVSAGLLNATGNGGSINISGGTMTFTDTNWFDTGASYLGNYIIDFDNDGVLNLNIADGARRTAVEGFLTTAINDGDITYQGGAFNLANMTVDGTTITLAAIPEPGTYAFFAGCFGLTWVMLRRRRS